jgi:hypothetical protein
MIKLPGMFVAASCFLAAIGCTANVENPTVNQQGRGGDTTCVGSCDSNQTTCAAKCTDDTCKATCTSTHTDCTATCSKDGG